MKIKTLSILLVLCCNHAFPQEPTGLMLKSNVLNLIAKRPTLSIEKTFSGEYGLEVGYTSGELKNFVYRDYYRYDGFLLRAKKYIGPIKTDEINAFYGVYFGNLNKKIISHGSVDNTGFFSWGENRDFSANSLRYGATFGISVIPKKHFMIEGLTALGYGNYFHVKNNLNSVLTKGYLDLQLWLSVGYFF